MSIVVDDLQDNQSATIETRVAELINQAILESDGSQKVKYLYQVQELALNHGVLDNFLDEILGFQNDRSPLVKKFVIGFIEAACKKDGNIFPKSIINLSLLLNESNSDVIKRSIQAASQLYKVLIAWISTKVNSLDDVAEQTWQVWLQIKSHICNLLDTTDNDGIRTQCIKFMESLVLLQTKPDKLSDDEFEYNIHDALVLPPSTSQSDKEAPSSVSAEQKAVLLDEAMQVFDQMIIFHGTSHISSVNLMATMQSLVVLARQRSNLFMGKVIQALEALYANLPPTLATSQVLSVRKYLKLQLTILLKHPLAVTTPKYQIRITQLLGDIGVTQSEINKIFNELKKKGLRFEISDSSKRIKLEKPEEAENIVMDETAIDITADEILPSLQNIEIATDLVAHSIKNMPDIMPPHFVASFVPVAVTGTPAQIKHLARLLAAQLTAAGLGVGVDKLRQDRSHNIATHAVNRPVGSEEKRNETQVQRKIKLQQLGKPVVAVKPKQLNLNEVTKELEEREKEQMVVESVKRILKDEKRVFIAPAQLDVKKKVLSTLANEFHNTECTRIIRDYIFDDIRNRHEISYAIIKKNYEVGMTQTELLNQFEECFHSYLDEALRRPEIKDRDFILPKLFAESPILTDYSVKLLEDLVVNQKVPSGLTILTQLIDTRLEDMTEDHKLLLLNLKSMYIETKETNHQSPPSSPPTEQQQPQPPQHTLQQQQQQLQQQQTIS